MAPANKKTTAVSLGMQTIAVAEFDLLANGGLVLSAYAESELMPDPAADLTRPDQIRAALQEIQGALGRKGAIKCDHCLPSQAVFSRFVKLPGSSPEDIRSIIAFEAQQNVPFPIDEVIWDYQILGGEREGNWDVALVAIKADQLEEIYRAGLQGGFPAAKFDVAPMALSNAFRYNYSDVTGVSMLVDIGARTTNLIFLEGDKVFSRTIPIGGNTISANLAKELEVDISVAELLKKEKGFVALGGAYAEPEDASVGKISKVARNTLTRLHAEITRSISFYRANQGGRQPSRALLCGGAVAMPYMLEFFAEKLQMPIEFFNPLRNITVANEGVAQAVANRTPALGTVVGVALRSLGNCPVEISLCPRKVARDQAMARRRPALIAAVVLLGLALLSSGLYFQRVAKIYGETGQAVQNDINTLTSFNQKITSVRQEQERLAALVEPIVSAVEERGLWLQIVDTLASSLPDRFIWVTQMTPMVGANPVNFDGVGSLLPAGNTRPGAAGEARAGGGPRRPGAPEGEESAAPTINAIKIEGLYLDQPINPQEARVVDAFVDRLESSGLFAIDKEVRTSMTRTVPDGTSWAYSFSIVLPLKTPIALP